MGHTNNVLLVTLTCTASSICDLQGEDTVHLEEVKVKVCDVITTIKPKGWMDHQLMLVWIKKVLVKHTKGRHVLLVFDTFMVHLKDDILEENNISHVLILGGCKSKIQRLDVCLNKTFTAYIRGVWEEYKAGQAQSTHIASQIPTASRKDILSGL